MKLFYSGGGSPWLPEMQLEGPCVMASFFMVAVAPHMKKGQKTITKFSPDTRVKRLMKARRKALKKGKKK